MKTPFETIGAILKGVDAQAGLTTWELYVYEEGRFCAIGSVNPERAKALDHTSRFVEHEGLDPITAMLISAFNDHYGGTPKERKEFMSRALSTALDRSRRFCVQN